MKIQATTIYECARCSRVHNGSSPGPGWGHEPGLGILCDDCSEHLELRRKLGLEQHHAAA